MKQNFTHTDSENSEHSRKITDDMTPTERFAYFIEERHKIYLRRQQKQPSPWTTDPILANYRFCNIYRQLDKVTIWLNENWYPAVSPEYMIFMACVARIFNDPEPLTVIQKCLRAGEYWNPAAIKKMLKDHQNKGGMVRGNAYIVSTNGQTIPFVDYVVDSVLTPIREAVRAGSGQISTHLHSIMLCDIHKWLLTFQGMGSFMAGQVIADVKYANRNLAPQYVADWWNFVVPGPGSKRGLNRLLGRHPKEAMSEKEFHKQFHNAMDAAQRVISARKWPSISAQDVQNCLCEFDKYERALHGEGRPKQRYTQLNQELF